MEKFVQLDSKRPDINSIILKVFFQDFWRHVLASPTQSLSPFLISPFHAPPKVTQLNIIFCIELNILRLQVPMKNSAFMAIVYRLAGLEKYRMDFLL